ncbi:MAG TPA: TonB-dependent receptor [Myxococcota bacterium]|nr:TonB-dependent receptor [Myxococcota bacterium]HRY96777.1 TonB-dependent receptor [Myxococcota bacterium]
MPRRIARTLLLAAWALGAQALAQEPATQEEAALQSPPELVELVQAELPEGTAFPAPEVLVLLELDVDAQGEVEAVRVAEGAGEPFDGAALAAARRFRFKPALLTTGEAVPVTITFRMRLSAPPAPAAEAPAEPEAPREAVAPVRYTARLLERGTRRPLAGVELVLLGGQELRLTAATDEEGRARLEVPATAFQVQAVPAGHEPLTVEVSAAPGEEREETFYLETLSTGFETTIRAERVRREVTKQVLPRELVARLPGTSGDTLKVVQNLPGVARASFGGGDLVLRGASPGDTRVFLEGQEIPSLYHFGGLRSTFHPAFLEAVEFIPGNFGADFGRAMGGIIDVQVRDPARDGFHGRLDVNLYDFGLVLEGPVSEDWSLGGAFHRSWVDTFLGAVLPEDSALSFNTAPRFYDYQILAAYRPDANHHLLLTWYGSMDKVEVLFERPPGDPAVRENVNVRTMFHDVSAVYDSRLGDALSQQTSLQIGYQALDLALGPELYFNLGIVGLGFRSAWELQALPWLAVRAGLDFKVDRVSLALNSATRPLEGEQTPPQSTRRVVSLDTDTTLFQPALFLELRFEPLDALMITPALRVDYYGEIERWTFDPRLSASWEAFPGTILKAGVGYFQQPPTADQSSPVAGNPQLYAPRSTHSSLGVSQRILDGLTVEATGFYKWLDRQVTRNPLAYVDPGQPEYLNRGTGRIGGLELLVRAELGGFTGWLAYTFQRSFRKDVPGGPERPFDFDQPHILTLVGTYDFGAGWSAGLRFRLVSGNPSTPVVSAVYDSSSDQWVPIYGPVNSTRQDLFHQLDLRADKVWTFDLWKLGLFLDIQNVYNQANQEGVSFSFDYRERSAITGLPILPILGLYGEW